MTSTPVARAELALLLEISRSLLQFEHVDDVVPLILGLIGGAVPLDTVVVVGALENHTTLRGWRAADVTVNHLEATMTQARATYERYFADEASSVGHLHEAHGRLSEIVLAPPHRRRASDLEDRFIMLPLVVAHQPVFGALQIECSERIDEAHLAFLNTVVNLLAIALDRHLLRQRETAERERAQRLERETAELLKREQVALEKARAAIRTRDLFLAIVSHDLRDLAGAVRMAVHVLLTPPPTDPVRRHQLETIKRATIQMAALLQDLLDTAAIDNGGLSIHPESCSVAAIAEHAAAVFQSLADGKAVRLMLEMPPALPPVWADPQRVGQALANLVKNAIRFSPHGGSITITASATGEHVRVEVGDEGPGIALEAQPFVFKRYWTGDASRSVGTGLGLYIVRAIVEKLHGTVGVDSQLGAGTRFWFTIPVHRP